MPAGCLIRHGVEWVSETVNEWARNVSTILYRANYGTVLDADWGSTLGAYPEEYLIRNYMGLGGTSLEMEGQVVQNRNDSKHRWTLPRYTLSAGLAPFLMTPYLSESWNRVALFWRISTFSKLSVHLGVGNSATLFLYWSGSKPRLDWWVVSAFIREVRGLWVCIVLQQVYSPKRSPSSSLSSKRLWNARWLTRKMWLFPKKLDKPRNWTSEAARQLLIK